MKEAYIVFEVFFLYAKVSFYYLFGIKKREKLYLAGKCLFENMSYRLPQRASEDVFIGIRVFKDFWTGFFSHRNIFTAARINSTATIFDGGHDYSDHKQKYVGGYIHQTPFFISRTDIIFFENTIRCYFLFLLVLLVSPLIIFLCLFAKNRANLALLIKEFPETVNLLHIVNDLRIDEIYFYCPYEVDANLMTLALMKHKKKIIKIPSHGPLKTHNSILFSDAIVLSSQYQFDELEELKETIKVDKIYKWFPQTSWMFIHKYLDKKFSTPQNVIGFYSHGSWARKKSGHRDDGMHIDSAEVQLLKEIAGFLDANSHVRLIVFPHPKEKKAGVKEDMISYYDAFLKGRNYSIFDRDTKTALSFEMADVGVAAFSAITFERLLCGFKTLVGAYGIPGFPISGSAFNNITVKTSGLLGQSLSEALKMDTDSFFKKNKLEGYRYFEYEYPSFTPEKA